VSVANVDQLAGPNRARLGGRSGVAPERNRIPAHEAVPLGVEYITLDSAPLLISALPGEAQRIGPIEDHHPLSARDKERERERKLQSEPDQQGELEIGAHVGPTQSDWQHAGMQPA
jgi:hypothetical protein